MKHLIDKKKFMAEIKENGEIGISFFEDVEKTLSKHLKDIVDEPHYPSGMDRHDIDVRNELRSELRSGKYDK